jgi:hypothetical protein
MLRPFKCGFCPFQIDRIIPLGRVRENSDSVVRNFQKTAGQCQ